MNFNFSTTEGTILDPPKYQDNVNPGNGKKQLPLIRERILVDSTFRPSGSTITDYTYELTNFLHNVERIELEKLFLPNSIYMINNFNNEFIIDHNGTSTTINLPNGNYDDTTVVTMLETELQSGTSDPNYTVSIDSITDLMTISTTSNTFTVLSSQMPNLAPLFGFNSDIPLPSAGTVTSSYPINLNLARNILVRLSINADKCDSMNILRDGDTEDDHCFAYIPLVHSDYTYTQITKDMTNAFYNAYTLPIHTLKKLSVSLRQILPDGTIVIPDFNNYNHTMELELICTNNKNEFVTFSNHSL